MKIAVLWGAIFGISQAIISLVMSIYLSSPNMAALACVGLLLSFALNVACGLAGAIHAKAFGIGLWAGIIAIAIEVIASLIGYMINPALLEVGVVASVISFAISIGFGIVLSAIGASIGYFISRKSTKPIQTNA
ncbi:MAG: hypothetical protein U0V02_12900 [Anaerolineales bacterium]